MTSPFVGDVAYGVFANIPARLAILAVMATIAAIFHGNRLDRLAEQPAAVRTGYLKKIIHEMNYEKGGTKNKLCAVAFSYQRQVISPSLTSVLGT